MLLLRNQFRFIKRALGPLIAIGVFGYFSYHIIEGNHGIRAWWKLDTQLSQAHKKLEILHKTRDSLEQRVQLLNPSSLCPDMLEERSREVLGYIHPNEIVILH